MSNAKVNKSELNMWYYPRTLLSRQLEVLQAC